MNMAIRILMHGCLLCLSLILPISSSNAARTVEIDAAGLQEGALPSWKNTGVLGGEFKSLINGGATVSTVDGRRAVTFDGSKDYFKSTFGAPAEITGSHAFSVAVWVNNPTIETAEEPIVYWAHRGSTKQTAHLNYCAARNSGAVVHWAADLSYAGGIPEAGKWHLIVLTYAGGKDGEEKVIVDGKLNVSTKVSLDLFTGDPIYLATTELERFFSGSIAGLEIFDYALPDDEISFLMGAGGKQPRKALVKLSAEKLQDGRLAEWQNEGSLGGSFQQESTAPAVKEFLGRKAVHFNGKSFLESTFESRLGNGPYTVEFWVSRTDINDIPCPVLSFTTPALLDQARFGFSKAPKDGAFISGGTRLGFEYPGPSKNRWYHIAYTCTADGNLTVFVDGEVLKSVSGVTAALDSKMMLGAAWLPKRTMPFAMPPTYVSRLCIHDTALDQKAVRNSNGTYTAFSPAPAENSVTEGFSTVLSWNSGDSEIRSFDVYVGENKDEVAGADRSSKLFAGNVDKPSFGPISLQLVHTYYWRVDENGQDGNVKHKGKVWSFLSETGKASSPKPRTAVSAVPANVTDLSWVPGKYASKQTVLFSDNIADVESGKAVLAKDLEAKETSCKLPSSPLEHGKTYYWRVSSENGEHPPTTGDIWYFRTEDKVVPNDITFFAVTDLHYGVTPTIIRANQMTVDFMNVLPGTDYPPELGGKVLTPRGVVITGDLTNDGNPDQWSLFTADYGVNGEGRIAYPVYEGWGNHDGGLAPEKGVAPGIAMRNKSRPCVSNVSRNGLHYSWDWDRLHMIQLNLYPGDKRIRIGSMDGTGHEPQMSLEFLKEDLEKNVGRSGRPVMIMMHFGFDEGFSLGWNWWCKAELDAFHEAIKDYNVIGLLFGHTHAAASYKWRGIDVYNCASGQRDPEVGECMVFHITSDEIAVLHRFKDRWAEVWRKPVSGIFEKDNSAK